MNLLKALKRCLVISLMFMATRASADGGILPETRKWVVDGVQREALVYHPAVKASLTAAPLVFAFHGHGGTMRQASRTFAFHREWPEAVVIYPQGNAEPVAVTGAAGLTRRGRARDEFVERRGYERVG